MNKGNGLDSVLPSIHGGLEMDHLYRENSVEQSESLRPALLSRAANLVQNACRNELSETENYEIAAKGFENTNFVACIPCRLDY